MEKEYEDIVKNNSHLNLLINEHQYSILCTIKPSEAFTTDFIDWISPKYFEALKAIYANSIEENQGTICSVLRASFLANAETHEKMTTFLAPHIDKATENAVQFYRVINNNRHDAITAIERIGDAYDYLTRAIFSHVNSAEMEAKKREYAETMLKIADIMRKFRPRSGDIEFAIYTTVTEVLKELNVEADQQEVIHEHTQTVKRKNNWYIVGTIAILILVLLRFLARLS